MIVITIIVAVITAIANIFFAIAVFNDAVDRHNHGNYIWFVHPAIWALATLVGGVFAAGVYWALHYAAFAADYPAAADSDADPTSQPPPHV